MVPIVRNIPCPGDQGKDRKYLSMGTLEMNVKLAMSKGVKPNVFAVVT